MPLADRTFGSNPATCREANDHSIPGTGRLVFLRYRCKKIEHVSAITVHLQPSADVLAWMAKKNPIPETMKTAITEKLEALKIDYTVKPHSQPVYTSEAAARERGVRLSQIVKTMLLMDRKERILVAVLPGDKKLDLKKIKKLIGVKDLRFLDRDTIEQRLGLVAGAIAPIAELFGNIPILVDPSVFRENRVDISSGDPCAGLELTREHLRILLKGSQITPITR